MSQAKLENVSGPVLIEPVLPDPGRARGQVAKAKSFDDHLWRLQMQSERSVADRQSDSARFAPPQATPLDAPGQSAAEGDSTADDGGGNGQDRADADSDGNVAGQAASEATSERDRAEKPEAEDEDGVERSQMAEAGSATAQEQTTDADADVDGAEAADRTAPGKARGHGLDGQLVTGNAGQRTAQPTTAAGASDQGAAQNATSVESVEDAAPATQALASRVAAQGGLPAEQVAEADPAAATLAADTVAKAAHDDAGQHKDAVAGRKGSRRRADGAGETSPQSEQASQLEAPQRGAPVRVGLHGGTAVTADDQIGKSRGQPADAAGAAGPLQGHVAANQPVLEDEQMRPALERKAHGGEETARPVPSGAADNRLNASLRTATSQETRPATTPQSDKASESVQVDRARFVQRVARAFGAVGRRDASVRLRLSPPELGSLRLEVSVRNGLMTARVEAETTAARNLLLDNLPALRDRLAQQDIKIKQFDVALMDRSPGGLPDQTADHTQSHQGGGSQQAPQPDGDTEPDVAAIAGRSTANRPGEGTQLNVIV